MLFLPRHDVNRHRRRALLARRWWAPGAISWGTDLSGIAPTILNANADVVVGAASTTTAIHSQSAGVAVPLIQRTNNDFYPIITGALALAIGGAAPTAGVISYAVVAGTAVSSFTIAPAYFVINTTIMVPFFLVGPLSQSAYGGAGTDPLIQVNFTTNGATVKAVGSQALFQLVVGVE